MTEPVPVAITFTLEETDRGLWSAAMANFGPEQPERFEAVGKPIGETAAILNDPVFKDGFMYWCTWYMEAHIIAQVHRANGYRAEILYDTAGNGCDDYTVLSTRAYGSPEEAATESEAGINDA